MKKQLLCFAAAGLLGLLFFSSARALEDDEESGVAPAVSSNLRPLSGRETLNVMGFPNNSTLKAEPKSKPGSGRRLMLFTEPSERPARRIIKFDARLSEKYLRKAKKSYLAGDFAETEELVGDCLGYNPQNIQAKNFANKLAILKQRLTDAQMDLSEQSYYRGEEFYKSGNTLEALYAFQRALKLNPKSQKALTLFTRVYQDSVRVIPEINKGDRRDFLAALRSFLDGDFRASAGLFRRLQVYYPELSAMLGATMVHFADQSNLQRSDYYVQRALDNIAKERFSTAREDLYLALECDRANTDARFLLEQVKLELGM